MGQFTTGKFMEWSFCVLKGSDVFPYQAEDTGEAPAANQRNKGKARIFEGRVGRDEVQVDDGSE